MSLGDNLGLAGLVLTLLTLAVASLWPNKKWVGWAACSVAGALVAAWIFLEFGSLLGVLVAELILVAATLIAFRLPSKSKGDGTPAFLATASNADYPPGTRLGDVQWSRRFTDLRIILSSPAGADLEDIDLVLLPDVPIAAAYQITRLPDVSCSRVSTVEARPEFIKGATGERTILPLLPIASTRGYLLQCRRLPRKQQLEIMLAAVAMSDQNRSSGPFDRTWVLKVDSKDEKGSWTDWFGYGRDSKGLIEEVYSTTRPIPKSVQVEGTYKMMAQQKNLSQQLQVHDFIAEVLPKVREQMNRNKIL